MSDDAVWSPEAIRGRLATLGARPRHSYGRIPGVDPEMLTPAAVLIALCEVEGRMCTVFTKRPETMPEHSGEVSFPGGRLEEGDRDLCDTALRETEEEIGLAADDVTVYGAFLDMPTVTGYHITAYVGEFDYPYEFEPSPREIDALFVAPLMDLADPERHRIEKRSWGEQTFDIHFFDYKDHVIWGATGHMLDELLRWLGGCRDSD